MSPDRLPRTAVRMLRVVARLGQAGMSDVLAALEGVGITGSNIYYTLNRLQRVGWLVRCSRPGSKDARRVAWMVSEDGLAALWSSDGMDLPARPPGLGPRPADGPAINYDDLGTALPRTHHHLLSGAVWKPAPQVTARPGADDHKRYASLGVRC